MRRMYGDMESTSVYRQMRTSMDNEPGSLTASSSGGGGGGGLMPDLFSSYNIRMGSGLATVQSAKEATMSSSSNAGRVKVKRKVIKKKKKEDKSSEEVLVETSSTTSTSSVFASTSESPSPVSTTTMPNPTTVFTNIPTTNTPQAPPLAMTTFEGLEEDTTATDVPEILEDPATADSTLSQLLADVSLDSLDDEFLPDLEAEDIYQEYDDVEEMDYSGDSLNACPVKEEVFAPYWANNTRNQVLALLNLYPFEQYIHMETCKFEHEEILCRRGCRCEQQFRLHRLLAFDPSNECRGIFSDWFRFPSYCNCKCYNVPEDFMPRRHRKPRIEYETGSQLGELPESETFQNIPAILPYEAKQALLREMSRKHRTLPLKRATEAAETLEEMEQIQDAQQLAKSADEDHHFFYGNMPVMEFKLPDGSKGAVQQTPRK